MSGHDGTLGYLNDSFSVIQIPSAESVGTALDGWVTYSTDLAEGNISSPFFQRAGSIEQSKVQPV